MAEVTGWTAANTQAQFRAIALLRWQIFRNSLRRKGGMGDLVANLVMVPIFLGFVFGPAVGAGFVSWYITTQNQLGYLAIVLWVLFAIAQVTNIQLGKADTTFDPTQLIRFPLNFRGYAVIRVFFGLLAPSNIFATVTAFAVALGVSLGAPSLTLAAFGALAAFALANIFFTRMIFTWIDRWLATRRAREIFTGLIFVFSLGIQWLNFTFNPGFHHGHNNAAAHLSTAQHYYGQAQPVLALLPPGLVAHTLIAARDAQPLAALACIVGILLFAALFFAVFAMRLYKEFRGENLSNQANAVAKPTAKAAGRSTALPAAAPLHAPDAVQSHLGPPPVIAGVLGKEFLTIRRNTGVFYAIVAPLVFVVLIVSKMAAHAPIWIIFPGAVAYTMLGISPLAYNSLGLEATGIQFYFLAPVRWRDVFLAKNLMNVALAAVEFIATFITVTVASHAPSLIVTLSALLWAVAVLSISLSVGNRMSITSPKKLDPSKLAGKQASPLSSLAAVGIILGMAAIGALCIAGTRLLGVPWLLLPLMLALAAGGLLIYNAALNRLDKTVADHRDTLIEILCKAG